MQDPHARTRSSLIMMPDTLCSAMSQVGSFCCCSHCHHLCEQLELLEVLLKDCGHLSRWPQFSVIIILKCHKASLVLSAPSVEELRTCRTWLSAPCILQIRPQTRTFSLQRLCSQAGSHPLPQQDIDMVFLQELFILGSRNKLSSPSLFTISLRRLQGHQTNVPRVASFGIPAIRGGLCKLGSSINFHRLIDDSADGSIWRV